MVQFPSETGLYCPIAKDDSAVTDTNSLFTQFFQAEAGPDPENGFPALRRRPLPSDSTSGQGLRPDGVPVEKKAPGTDEKPGKDGAFGENMGIPAQERLKERSVGQPESDFPCHR